MPFIANTPESLVARSDSKNPATTCRGITSGGRPCRRPLNAADAPVTAVPARLAGSRRGAAGLRVDDPRDEQLYCWQHKDQANQSAHSSPGSHGLSTTIEEGRSSVDTLADRLGLVSASLSNLHLDGGRHKPFQPGKPSAPSPRPSEPKSYSTFCCCFRFPDDELPTPPARPSQPPGQTSANPSSHVPQPQQPRPPSASASSHTARLLSVIPPTLPPATASSLMTELAKPVSETDEAGYIYMFWLTPESESGSPPADAARSLLVPPGQPDRGGQRRVSDVLASFAAAAPSTARGLDGAASGHAGGSTGKLLLKIGRANNVQRRLNEWKRQCGYDVSLIRYYPYIPSGTNGSRPGSSNASVPRKLPHSHKVERLVHLELTGRGLRVVDREKCPACGREHREWFEVEASRKAVMEVDEVIRRWSDWDEHRQ